MLKKFLLFCLLYSSSVALEISLESAREENQFYSLLHLKNPTNFLCQEEKNEFGDVTKIICAFTKKPPQKLKPLTNEFFTIESFIQKNTFFLIVKPLAKMKLIPIPFDLVRDGSVYSADVELCNYWVVVGYKTRLPLIYKDKPQEKGINFPFTMEQDTLPFVGGLDIKGNPVHIKKVQDVTDYLKIKKAYAAKDYTTALELIDTILYEYPNSLFRAELLYYKILVYSKLKDYDSVLEFSKEFLQEYSSDENIPEVLALTANAYAKNGLNIDADYFFDRLFSEHADSVYAQWGYIYKGEMLESGGAVKKALIFYLKALNTTKNIDVAVMAAFHLAQYYLNKSNFTKASEYLEKIVKVKPQFFIEHKKTTLEIMDSFVQEWHYQTAVDLAKSLLHYMNKKDDDYEKLLRNYALWLTKTKHKKEALKALNQYLKEFKYGDYIDEIQVAKDELFFDLVDENKTKRIEQYNKLIEDYEGDDIAKRAIYEKAKLLLEEKKYQDVLALEGELNSLDSEKYDDAKQLVIDAAKGLMLKDLANKECKKTLQLFYQYEINLELKYDDSLYECAVEEADYKLANSLVQQHLKEKNLMQRKKWMMRYVKVLFAQSHYKKLLLVAKDLLTLADKKQHYKEVYRYIFDSYKALENQAGMIESIANIEEYFGHLYTDIERYVDMVDIGVTNKDDAMIIKYGKIVRELQTKTKTNLQSPYIEFSLYQAYIDLEDYNKALEVIKSLNNVKTLTKTQRARQKYLLGSVYNKLWRDNEAREAYEDAIKADPQSPWAKLAQSAKAI